MGKTKVKTGEWTEQMILDLLNRSDLAVIRGILAIYNNQEADEKLFSFTKHNNHIGFNKFDVWFGSSMAKEIQAGKHLSKEQIKSCRKILWRYRRQLCEIANNRVTDPGYGTVAGYNYPEGENISDRGSSEQPGTGQPEPGNRVNDKDESRFPKGGVPFSGVNGGTAGIDRPRKITVNQWIRRDREKWERTTFRDKDSR